MNMIHQFQIRIMYLWDDTKKGIGMVSDSFNLSLNQSPMLHGSVWMNDQVLAMCGTKVNEYGMVNMFVIIQKAMDGHSTVSLIEDILENIRQESMRVMVANCWKDVRSCQVTIRMGSVSIDPFPSWLVIP